MTNFEFLFYETTNGKLPVEKFLDELLKTDKQRHKKTVNTINIISLLKRENKAVPSSYFKHLEDDLWEIRADNVRILCFEDRLSKEIILMAHAIVKKQDKIPSKELNVLRERRKEWEQRKHRQTERGLT